MKSIFRGWTFSGLLIVAAFFLILACSNKKESSKSGSLTSITLTQSLIIPANSEEALVGNFAGLAVADDGTIYAADTDQQKIHVFSSDGAYQGSIGRRGKGPGEFSDLDAGIRIEGDTLYSLQARARRIDLFDIRSGSHIRSIPIPEAEVDGSSLGNPQSIFPQTDGSLLLYSMNPHFFAPDANTSRKFVAISRLDAAGNFTEKNIQQYPSLHPSNNGLVLRKSDGISVFRVNMYPEYMIAAGPDGTFYQATTDSLRINKYASDGTHDQLIEAKYQRLKYTSDDMDKVVNRYGENLRKAMNNAGVPEYWPAFQTMVVDDEGRCWVQLFKPDAEMQPWWIFDAEGDVKWEVTLPKDVTLYQIKQGKAYGIESAADALPAIHRYDVEM